MAKGGVSFEFDSFNKTLKGDKLRINLKGTVIPGFEDTWSRVLISIVDITELTKTKKDFELANKQLKKSNRKLEQLVLIDSHTSLFNHRYLIKIIDQ